MNWQKTRTGIDSLKVEGRNKTEYYAAVVARAYRSAIDDWYKAPESWDYKPALAELYTLQNRGYCLGFHDGRLTALEQNYDYTRTLGDWLFAGSIVEWQGDDAIFELRNCVEAGETIEFLLARGLQTLSLALSQFEDAQSGEITTKVSAGQGKKIRLRPQVWPLPLAEVKSMLPQYTVARKHAPLSGEPRRLLDAKKAEFSRALA